MKIMHVTITDPAILAEQPALPAFDAEVAEQTHADAHWTFGDAGAVRARCSLWWSNVPQVPGQRIGIIGHYAASSSDAGTQLLQLVCEELTLQGCTLAIGPMDGNTHRSYRFITERGSEPLFFLEPDHPDDWPEHFTRTGFTPLAHYYSALQTDLEQKDPRVPALEQRFREERVSIRPLNLQSFEDELHCLYPLVVASFQQNFLASPISEQEFFEQNRQLQPYVRPELVLLAEDERTGEPIGFVFALPDRLQAHRGETVNTFIVKTLAIHPAYGGHGLATLLVNRLWGIAGQLGYIRAIHALMHEQNLSRRISQRNQGRIIRRYTLFSRML